MAIPNIGFSQTILLNDAEIEQVKSHGPWPPVFEPDPSNRVSGDPRAVELGRQLFFSTGMSKDGVLACAHCHQPEAGFADGVDRAQGRQRLDRNTLSLLNLRQHRWFGWDGQSDNIWAQSIFPILNPLEMAMTPELIKELALSGAFSQSYTELFGSAEHQNETDVLVNIAKALAAYQETLVTGKTPFDHFRDALAQKDMQAAARYPAAAQRGLSLFLGRGNCSFCHSGAMFSNGEFHDAGIGYFVDETRVDSGRHGGIIALRENPFTLDKDHSDDPDKVGAWAVRGVKPLHSDFGTFRVPSLRNIANTAPYMHNGSLPDLAAVVDHYSNINLERLHADGEAILALLALSSAETSDLIAFLNSLSE